MPDKFLDAVLEREIQIVVRLVVKAKLVQLSV
jgi:hypothetical protein